LVEFHRDRPKPFDLLLPVAHQFHCIEILFRLYRCFGQFVAVGYLFFLDGVFRQGTYFGARFERYIPGGALHQNRLAIGMSFTGVFGALSNYFVAENFSEDFWLTYTTFLDFPIFILLFLLVLRWSRKKNK